MARRISITGILRSLPLFLAALLAGLSCSLAARAASPSADPAGKSTPNFRTFIESLWPDAARMGFSRQAFDTVFAGVVPDPSVAALTSRQPEFSKPIGAYLAAQVTPNRVAVGRRQLARWRDVLLAIQQASGVPGAIVIAIWGMETNYGVSTGSKDVIRSLATLAAIGYRPDLTRAELLSALHILKGGDVPRANLRGSWAGAMGLPQFMPSSFEAYAVDQDGDGRRDIWGDVPDALASIANFLTIKGWQPKQHWGFEVALPAGYDLFETRGDFSEWTARGVARADGVPFPRDGTATLFFPAGRIGPGFVVTSNYEVLKTYNFSDAYVLSVATLADRIEGEKPLSSVWPAEPPQSRDNRIALQARLAAIGYNVDNREGRISLALRDIIRRAQLQVGLVPDGNPSDDLLRALRASP